MDHQIKKEVGKCENSGCIWTGFLDGCEEDTDTETMDGHIVASYNIWKCPKCGEWTIIYDGFRWAIIEDKIEFSAHLSSSDL